LSRSWLPSDYYPRNRSHNDAEQGSNDRRQNPRPPLFLRSFHLVHYCLHPVRSTRHFLLRMPEQPGILCAHLLACAHDPLRQDLGRQLKRRCLRHGAERRILFLDPLADPGKHAAVIGLRLVLGGEPFERAAQQRHLAPQRLERLCRG
jgi:hypothetical protein